ncbi:RHS repeat-associated core domain-containing protein [Enterovibrio norvegicus]|nr:RHS repeat-associated core domain-containing protein [Enterovibrio norvegicus]
MAMLSGEGSDYEVYHYHLDQIGTPTDITDLHGKSVWSVQYRAYGNILRKHVEEIVSPLRFQGQYFDEETGLHYNRHRYYSPNTGRFITADPIGLAGGLNNYQYVPNPTGWADPLGLAVVEAGGVCCGGSQKPDFYVGSDGPATTLPSTGYRYMDSSYAERTMASQEAPLSYFGFEKFETGQQARDAFQIFYEEGNPASWSDARLRGEFDTLQLFDPEWGLRARVPHDAGDRGGFLEPLTEYYPQYGKGGGVQLVPRDRMTVKFDDVKLIPEE